MVIAALCGLLVGSFLNVVIARLPADHPPDRSLGGRSRCPSCRNQIAAYDNVPVVSWILLRGRCRACSARIPAQYPLVELLTSVLWAAVAATSSSWQTLLPGIVLMTLLIPLTWIDMHHRILPNRLTYPGIVVGLAMSIGFGPQPRFISQHWWWLEVVISAAAASGFLLVAALIKPGGMGLGDVKLAAMMGAFLGAPVAVAMFASFILALLPSLALIVRHGMAARKLAIPFGPFLAAGTVVGWFWGAAILTAYLHGF